MSQNSTSIRRAAVLLSGLGPVERNLILQRLCGQFRVQVESALECLSQVAADESEHVARAFVEALRKISNRHGASEHVAPVRGEHALFLKLLLEQTPEVVLQQLVVDEHPQTVAVIIACLSPARAADLLSTIDDKRRSDILVRVLDLDDFDTEALSDIRHYLTEVIQRHIDEQQRSTVRLSRVKAIFGAADSRLKAEISRLLEGQTSGVDPHKSQDAGCVAMENSDTANSSVEFDRIVDFPSEFVTQVFCAVPPDVTAVAVMGASQAVRKDILMRVPDETRAEIHAHISSLGPLRLTDIQLAQKIILRLLERVITTPATRFDPGMLLSA